MRMSSQTFAEVEAVQNRVNEPMECLARVPEEAKGHSKELK